MKAIIPAAGYATRMYPLTLNKPKTLLNIDDKPILDHVISKVTELNVNEIIIVCNNKFYNAFLDWKSKFECKIPIRILNDGSNNEDDRLGAIGDIYFALENQRIREDFVVVNADNLFFFDLKEMHDKFLEKGRNMLALYECESLDIARNMGSVRIDSDERIVYFKEKDKDTKSKLCSIGIYFFKAEAVEIMKKFLESNNGDKTGDLFEWLYTKEDIYGHLFDKGKWFDIGSLESYSDARKFYSEINSKH